MVNFCSVANCLNSSRNHPDLSFFCFPSEGHFRRLWKNFCRRSDPEFQNQKNPRICSAHFEASSIKKSLCGRKEVIPGELPKYFNPSTHQCRVSSREKRLEDRKRRAVDEKCPEPQKRSLTEEDKDICFLSDDAALLDHNYCHLLPNDKGTLLLSRHLTDIFGASEGPFSKVFKRGFAFCLQFFVTFFLNGLVRKKLRKSCQVLLINFQALE